MSCLPRTSALGVSLRKRGAHGGESLRVRAARSILAASSRHAKPGQALIAEPGQAPIAEPGQAPIAELEQALIAEPGQAPKGTTWKPEGESREVGEPFLGSPPAWPAAIVCSSHGDGCGSRPVIIAVNEWEECGMC